jgi:hypothetical protein
LNLTSCVSNIDPVRFCKAQDLYLVCAVGGFTTDNLCAVEIAVPRSDELKWERRKPKKQATESANDNLKKIQALVGDLDDGVAALSSLVCWCTC